MNRFLVLLYAGISAAQNHATWMDYGGAPDAAQYSSLGQVNRTNVTKLQVAWTYPTADGNKYFFNPIVVDGTMYVLAKNNSIVALDSATGKERWAYVAETDIKVITNRGINYWESKDRSDRRLLFACNHSLRAIDARTGKAIPSFGINGRVDLKQGLDRDPKTIALVQSTTPGRVFENLIVVGSATNLRVRVRAGRHTSLRRSNWETRVDVSHHSAPRRVRLRHLAEGCLEDSRRRERLGRDVDR